MKKTRAILILALVASLGVLGPGKAAVSQQTAGELFEKALYVEEGQGDLQKAIGIYQDILKRFPDSREVAAKAQLHIGLCYEKLGLKEAEKAFQKVINDFPEQVEAVKLARTKLTFLPGARAALEKGAGEMKIRKVWDEAADMGAPSPDGRYLSYVDWENYANLGIHDFLKGEDRLLTSNSSWETGEMSYQSVFSPDSAQIAFSWQTKEGAVQMRTVGGDGSAARILNDGKDLKFQMPVSWSGDGKHILAIQVAPDQGFKIVLMSVKDGAVRLVKSLAPRSVGQLKACLSPDARNIVYDYPSSQASRNRDIFLVSADGSLQVPLVEHPADDAVLGWSPDGARVLFKSDRSGNMSIWAIDVNDGKPRGDPQLLRPDVGDISVMGLTRDGSLFYSLTSGWSDIFVAELDPQTGKVVSPPEKAIRQNEGFNSAPDWSPDGETLACRSQEGLLLHDLRKNETRKLATKIVGGLNFHYLRWSPDGHRINGVGTDEKGMWGALYAIDSQTGDSKIIARSDKGGFLFSFDWAPDGKSLYFVRRDLKQRHIMRHDFESGVEEEIYRQPNVVLAWLSVSPDGKQMAFATDEKLIVLSTAGGESKVLLGVKDVRTTAWTRDGKYVLYSKLRDGSKDMFDLWRILVNGGEPQKLDLSMRQLMHVRIHPDGRRIAFTASQRPEKSEVWVMENFLPIKKK